MWSIVFTSKANDDSLKIKQAGLKDRVGYLFSVLEKNPFQNPPPYEKLLGDFSGAYSRRINVRHRLVYQVLKKERLVKVVRMWSHYE